MKTNAKKGFTLIELLIVIAIIGILAAALLPNILGAPKSANDAARKVAMNDTIIAIEQLKAADGKLPGVAGTGECLANGDGKTGDKIKGLVGGSLADMYTSKKVTVSIATTTPCTGIIYQPINTDNYYVCAGMEVSGSANTLGTGYTDKAAAGYNVLGTAPASTSSIYCIKK